VGRVGPFFFYPEKNKQKLEVMKSYNLSGTFKNRNLTAEAYSNLYHHTVENQIRTSKENYAARPYLEDIWKYSKIDENGNTVTDYVQLIQENENMLKELRTEYKNSTENVIDAAMASDKTVGIATFLKKVYNEKTGDVISAEQYAQKEKERFLQSNASVMTDPFLKVTDPQEYNNRVNTFNLQSENIYKKALEDYKDMNPQYELKKLYSKNYTPTGKLDGSGDEMALNGVRYNHVSSKNKNSEGFKMNDDFLTNANTTAMYTTTKDKENKLTENVLFSFGSPAINKKELNTSIEYQKKAREFSERLQNDLNDEHKKENGIVATTTYQSIALSDENKEALHFEFTNPKYIQEMVGTEKNKGKYWEYKDLITNEGFTIYMDRNVSNNEYNRKSKVSVAQKVINRRGNINVDFYPDVFKDVKIIDNRNGTYSLNGEFVVDYDENGNELTDHAKEVFQSDFTDVSKTLDRLREYAADRSPRLRQRYNEIVHSVKRNNGEFNQLDLLKWRKQ
jgi:hypothetical protein